MFYSGIRTFHQILYGKFTLITDQKHLVKTPEPKRDRAASSWQITEVDSHVSFLLPLHQVAYKHRNADTLSWVPLQADSAPQSDLTCWISPCRKVIWLQKKLRRVGSWHSFRRDLSAFVGWRAVSPHGKHFWCLVSNLLKKYRRQCQLKSLSMQMLASAPVPARDGKLRPEGVNRGLNIDPPFNKMTRLGKETMSFVLLKPRLPLWVPWLEADESPSGSVTEHQNSSVKTLHLPYRISEFSIIFLHYGTELNKKGELMWNAFPPIDRNIKILRAWRCCLSFWKGFYRILTPFSLTSRIDRKSVV